MLEQVLEKLDWPVLLESLAGRTQTEQGKARCLQLKPTLRHQEIQRRWASVGPLRNLLRDGYRPPIGDLATMTGIFRAIELGQILVGEDLCQILRLLTAVRHVKTFADDFSERCQPLAEMSGQLYPLTKLSDAIRRAIGSEGEVLDDASDELKNIRRSKVATRKRIESKITQLLTDQDLEIYLQDKFYTIRSDRYVVPIRLDGRGRVKGSIQDTSSSGQTLFIEPDAIAPMNEQLRELELSEKLEVLRILKMLSAHAARELDTLAVNYDQLIELDTLCAEASLAHDLNAGQVELCKEPCLELIDARHPLVKDPGGGSAIGNDISLTGGQTTLIISGPNAGGKTVVLKTVAILQMMARSGLMLPANEKSQVYLFENIYLEVGDTQNLTASLSTFSGHLQGLRPIVQHASAKDLVLLDELAVGTEPNTGAAIAQAILEHLAERQARTLVTTHYDNLKVIATEDKRFRNGSMEFSLHDLKPTYQLILDVPGQSYGLELAEQLGMPAALVKRAKELRGYTASALDDAVADLMRARDEARLESKRLADLRHEAETEKSNFAQASEEIDKSRSKSIAKVEEKYQHELDRLRADFDESINNLKQMFKRLQKGEQLNEGDRQGFIDAKGQAEGKLQDFRQAIADLASAQPTKKELPGDVVEGSQLAVGDRVYIVPLAENGEVTRITQHASDPIEVTAGSIRLRLPANKLRKLSEQTKSDPPPVKAKRPQSSHGAATPRVNTQASFVLPTPRNTLDLRGKDVLDALNLTWNFLDKALLRGEQSVVILHGHGLDRLKAGIRQALETDCPYKISFRPGLMEEGGDGVTIVFLE